MSSALSLSAAAPWSCAGDVMTVLLRAAVVDAAQVAGRAARHRGAMARGGGELQTNENCFSTASVRGEMSCPVSTFQVSLALRSTICSKKNSQ